MKISFFKSLIQAFKDVPIRKKLLLSYFILIFLPLGLLTFIAYTNVSRLYESQIRYSASQSFDQAYTFLSYKVNTLIKSSDVIYYNSDVQSILSSNKITVEEDMFQQNIDMLKLDSFLNNLKNTEDVYRASLYVPGGLMYSDQDINFSNMDTFSTTDEYRRLMNTKDKVLWLPPQSIKNDASNLDPVPVISLLRKVRNRDQINEFIGIIKLSMRESNIQDIISKANITKDGVVYLQNSDGTIIICSNTENLKKLDLNHSIRKTLEGKNLFWETITIGKEDFAVITKAVENTDWNMVTAIPFSEILSQSNRIRDLMLLLMLIIGAVAYTISYFISTSTVKRIIMLMKKMRSVQDGNLDVSIASKSQDEIGKLMTSFNYMVKKISILVDEQYQSGKEIKSLELKALQAQINPHFLYNTLEMINWKALDNDVPEIAVIARSLAKFYKLSLNKGKDIVSIEDEINHIKNYIQIQNLRFDNRIELIMDIESEIYKCYILKITLQPIIENSILHGILGNRENQEGIIKLTGRFENENIILIIQDNGIGMTKEKAAGLLTGESTSESHGYGVRNINQRLQLCYGQQYGLTYHSSPGQGTVVEIKIPAIITSD